MSRRWHLALHPTVEKLSSHNVFQTNFFHPTHAVLHDAESSSSFHWKSRDHRKNRHRARAPNDKYDRRGHGLLERLGHMRRMEYWNVSWWVAMVSFSCPGVRYPKTLSLIRRTHTVASSGSSTVSSSFCLSATLRRRLT